MEKITKYKAVDGTEFYSESQCEQYEALIERVKTLMSELPAIPNLPGCGFENGDGYLQHDQKTFQSVKNRLLDIIGEKIDHKWIQQSKDDDTVHPSWVSRLLSDYDIKPLYEAWCRISNTDNIYREWGQGYYVLNPDRAKEVQLN